MVTNGNPPKSSISKTKLKNKPIKPPTNGKAKERKTTEKLSKVESRGKAIEKVPSPSPAPLGSSEDSEDSVDGGVDEEGMARLMEVLGEDGLDELGKAQLEALAGESGSEEEEESEAGSGDQEDDSIDKTGALSDESSEEDEDEGAPDLREMAIDEAPSVDEDAIPHQKLEVDNETALEQIRESIKLDTSLPWTETLILSYPHTIDVDVNDDLNRELAFYKQALHSALEARSLASKHKFPFTRPADYFAEMVKSDAHMERIRIRLLNETSTIKRSEDKRKEREGKKFGKQVQIEKMKERERSKKEMDERLKALKRKRKDVLDNQKDDEFDIAVEDAISDRPAKRGKASNGKSTPRSVRDKKYGFGGAGRRAKQNTRESTDNFDASRAGRGKKVGKGEPKGRHKTKRLGKSRRMTARSKS